MTDADAFWQAYGESNAAASTYDDFRRLPDDGCRYEILRGFVVREPAPASYHQSIVSRLLGTIWSQLEPVDRDGLFTAPIGVVLADDSVAQPDLLFIRRERMDIVRDDAVHGPPDLVVEILSPSTRTRDLRDKLGIYASLGVAEYWIVDPSGPTLTRHRRPLDDEYRDIAEMSAADTVHSARTGISIVLADILR